MKLKRYLCSLVENFETCWSIHALLELQHSDIKASFAKSHNVALHNFKPSQFRLLRGVVSIGALNNIVDESKLVSTISVDAESCRFLLRKTHGLPYAHELAEYGRVNMPIPAVCIDCH